MATINVIDQGDCDYSGEYSLLDALEDNGFDINSSCRSGHCGACRVKLISGKVDQIQSSSYDVEKDEILSCCVVPTTDISIDTDTW